jgi:branched-chain amino acid transport system substrate-binding protein
MTVTRRGIAGIGLAAPALALLPRASYAADTIKIGVPYPLTGGSASVGATLKKAIEFAADIVNNPHPELSAVPLAATEGLPGLGGRKVEPVFADHQGNPWVAQSEAKRLISQEKVVGLTGCYQSSCTLTASAEAERYGVPFLNGESTATTLTERGFEFFFRATPIGTHFGAAYAALLAERKAAGFKVDRAAMVHENTEYGSSTRDAVVKALQAKGIAADIVIPYPANTTDVSAQVLKLKSAEPDVVVFASYTSDAILYMRAMHTLNWNPPILIGDNGGFSDHAFIDAAGDLAQGVLNRSSFAAGAPGTNSFIANDLFSKAAGRPMDDLSARAAQGFLALAEAINRAGSVEPDKIQAALKAQDLKPGQLIVGYDGIKYDAKGQNALASTMIVQLDGKTYPAVWPAQNATKPVALPFKGWG